jgi:pilin isopeptide linkage protein/uncharacterized repeat protein (TIGR01451 family)
MLKSKAKTLFMLTALLCCVLLSMSAESVVTDIPTGQSYAHNIQWLSGSYAKISEDQFTMTSSPRQNYTTEHIMKLNFSYTGNAEKYDVEIRLPAHIFTDREGNNIGKIEIPLPKYNPQNTDESEPPNASAKFNWRIDEETDEIVISNYADIEGNFFLTADIKYYDIWPYLVKSGYTNTFRAYMNVKDKAIGQVGPFESNDITINYVTKADLNSVTKYASNAESYEKWQSSWGDPPEGIDTEDYFFVRWYAYASAGTDDTQPFSVSFKENDSGEDEYGTLFAVSSSKSNGFKRITLDEYNNPQNYEGAAFNNPYVEINNPSTYSSNDRTYWTQYLYCMYPRTLLVDQKATVKNSIEATLKGVDGSADGSSDVAESTIKATGSYNYSEVPKPKPTIQPDTAYVYKNNNGRTYGGINEIENGAVTKENTELNDYNAVNKGNFYFYGYLYGWYLSQDNDTKEFGVKDWTAELYDDYVRLYDGGKYTVLDENDYQFTKLYFSGFSVSDPKDKDGSSVSTVARDNDKYKPLRLLVKLNGAWKDYALIQKQSDGKYSFTPAAGYESVSVDTGSYLSIPLPKDTSGVKYSYTDSAAYVYFSSYSYLTTELKPSEKVLSTVKDKSTVTVYNTVYSQSLDSKGEVSKSRSDYSTHVLSRIVPISPCSKSFGSIKNEILDSRYYVPVTIDAYVQFDYPDAPREDLINSGYIIEQRNSTFYDLLPPGTYADLSTIRVTGYRGTAANTNFSTNVEVIDNWNNSGRTLLVVHAQAPEDSINFDYYRYANRYTQLWSGMKLRFNLYNPWINIADNGDTLNNYAAYESHDGPLPDGYPDNAGSSAIPYNLKSAFTDLNRDGNLGNVPESFLYCKTSGTFNILKAAEVGFKKAVSSPEEPKFGEHTKALLGGEYTYRLRLENAFSSSKDIVFYDILENAFGENDYWKGSLIGVDVSHALSKNIDVKTYYTTQALNDSDLFADSLHLDNHPEIWQSWDSNPPEDTSKVRAVAFDLRKLKSGAEFVARPGNSIYVSMIMRAPVYAEDHIKNNDLAYNRAFITNRKNSSSATGWDEMVSIEACNRVTVELKDMGLSFDKASSPASGTEEKPATVYAGDKIEYKINLSNANTAQSFKDILLEDDIPEGLSFNAEEIKAMLDDNPSTIQPISKSTRVKLVSIEGRTLKFRVISLAGKEKLSIIIPAVVEPMSEGKNTLFENTAKITGIFGVDYVLESNKTHHEQQYAQFTPEISKTLKGREMQENEFSFNLKDFNGDVIESQSNSYAEADKEDAMSFSTLYFDEPGEYIYTISEEKGMLDSVVYDESVYTIKINVTKQEDGSFNLETEFIKNGLETQSIDFTNEYKTRDFTAKKMWEVPADVTVADGAKHPEIELQLLRDGKPYGDDVTINPNDPDSFTTQENTFTWEKLPMYRADYALDTQTGERLESVYTVKEVHVPDNYFMGMEDEDQTVRNVYWPNARAVHKIWDGGMPEAGTEVTMEINQEERILNDGGTYTKIKDNPYGSITMDGIADEIPDPLPADPYELKGEFTPWVYTMVLPVSGTNQEGQIVHYFYTIKEQQIKHDDDFKLGRIKIIPAGGADVTNVRQTTEFTVSKSWKNGPDEKPTVTIWLLQDGKRYRSAEIENGETSYTFTDLPRFSEWTDAVEDNGFTAEYKEYKYTVEELVPENYVSSITETLDGADIVNEYVPPVKDIKAYKIWSGGPKADHTAVPLVLTGHTAKEPENIVEISNESLTVTENEDGSFSYVWSGLPETDDSAEAYIYDVNEETSKDGLMHQNGNTYKVSKNTLNDGTLEITNTYVPPEQSQIKLNIAKRIAGDAYAINAGDYSFKLSGDAPETIKPCDKDGRAEFTLGFNNAGSFTFTVSEVKGKVEGMQFDSSVYTIKADISFNEAENRFEHEVNILKDGKEYAESELIFTNRYKKPATDYQQINVPITANKVLKNGTLKADQFTFVLKDSRGKELARAANDAKGSIVFPDRTFSRVVKDYKYTLEELEGNDKNIKYDNTVYTIKISTAAVGGKLNARVDLEKDGVPYDGSIEFTNSSSVPPTGDSAPTAILIIASAGLAAFAIYMAIKRKEMLQR